VLLKEKQDAQDGCTVCNPAAPTHSHSTIREQVWKQQQVT